MQTIRYLTPFVIFLTLFLISAGVCYFYYNYIVGLETETQDFLTLSQEEVTPAIETHFEDLHKLETPVGFSLGFNKDTSDREDRILRRTNLWLQNAQQRLQGIANIKSLQGTMYSQYSALDPMWQIGQAEAALSTIENTIGDTIAFITRESPNDPGSGMIDPNREGLSSADEDRFRTLERHVRGLAGEVEGMCSRIRGLLSDARRILNQDHIYREDMDEVTSKMNQASEIAFEMINTLSFMDDNGDVLAIPGLMDSEPSRTARRLSRLLYANDQSQLVRQLQGGSDGGGEEPVDIHEVKQLAFRALVADYGLPRSQRRYNLNPLYLAGVTLEEIVDAQDLLIRGLVQSNHLLARELVVILASYHQDIPVDLQARSGNQIDTTIREHRRTATDVTRNLEDLRDSYEDIEEGVRTLQTNLQTEVRLSQETWWRIRLSNLARQVEGHQQVHNNLVEYFNRLKIEGIPLEGSLQYTGADGELVFADNESRTYMINIGTADQVHPGMRFVVYSDVGDREVAEQYGGTQARTIKGLIEVTHIPPGASYRAICTLVFKYGDREINPGDKIDNRLYHNGEFLRVCCVGNFEPPHTSFSKEYMQQYLRELGCEVQERVDVNTQLVIWSQDPNVFIPQTQEDMEALEMRERIRFDEILAKDLIILFANQ